MELKNTKLLLCGDLQHSFGRRHFHLQWPVAFKDCTENTFPLIWRSWCIFAVVCSILVPGNNSFFVHSACRIGSIIIIQIANDSICLSLWLNDCKERIFPLISNLSSLSSLSSFNSAELDSPLPSLPPLFVARDRCSRGLHTHVDGCSKVLLHINYPCVPYLVNGPRIQRYE